MLGKLWGLTLPLAFIISIVLLGMLWSSYMRPMRQTTIQPRCLLDAINKGWGKMPQCCAALPSSSQLHPALFCCSSSKKLQFLFLLWFPQPTLGLVAECQHRRKDPSLLLLCPLWRYPSTPPQQWHRWEHFQWWQRTDAPLSCSWRLNASSGITLQVGLSQMLCLSFAHVTSSSAGRLCSGKKLCQRGKTKSIVFGLSCKKIMHWERIVRK